MTTFYCLLNQSDINKPDSKITALQSACDRLGISFHPLITSDLNINHLDIKTSDLFYRISTTPASRLTEKHIIAKFNPITFYTNPAIGFYFPTISYFFHLQHNLPVVPTFPLHTNQPDILKSYIQKLNGFPVVVKIVGGSYGIGVIKVDSFTSLVTVIDTLLFQNRSLLLRQYIPHQRNFRLVVVGNKVIAAKANIKTNEEFRLNVQGHHKEEPIDPPDKLKQTAVKAVQILGLETGGVDIIESDQGQYYISEVNFPHNFWPTQQVTKIDIAYYMVKHLLSKSSHA